MHCQMLPPWSFKVLSSFNAETRRKWEIKSGEGRLFTVAGRLFRKVHRGDIEGGGVVAGLVPLDFSC